MYGILQYGDLDSYADATPVGTLRSRKKGYTITPVVEDNRNGNPETIAYEVEVRALALTLDSGFLSGTEYFFMIDLPDDNLAIYLDSHEYMINYDGLINRNGIEYNEVRIFFHIDPANYSNYLPTTPV